MFSASKHEVFRFMMARRVMPTLILLLVSCVFFSVILSMLQVHNTEMRDAYQQDRLDRAVSEIDKELVRIDFAQREILNSRTLAQFVYMYDDLDWYTRYALQNELYNALIHIRSYYSYIEGAWLYIPSQERLITDTRINAPMENWPAECVEEGIYHRDHQQTLYAVAKADADRGDTIAMLIVDLSDAGLQNRIDYIAMQNGDHVTLEWADADGSFARVEGLHADGESFAFRIWYRPDDEGSNAYANQVWAMGIAFVAVVTLLEVVGLIMWYRQVWLPLNELLITAFDQMEQGNLKYRIPLKSGSPFTEVYQRYNHMMERMEAYVENDLKQQILVSRANLKQLQAQINPHFMYNSYNILYRLIKRNDMENSKHLAEYLGRFYHYVTRNASDEMRLDEEIEHARTYAAIQKYRFGDALNMEIDPPDPQIASIRVPRLIIQPLIENAFKYGYEAGSADKMQLRLRYEIKSARCFDIYVENSGEISPEVLADIREKLKSEDDKLETTALINIHRRLKIYFGAASGLDVDRSPLGGLLVRMHIEDVGGNTR